MSITKDLGLNLEKGEALPHDKKPSTLYNVHDKPGRKKAKPDLFAMGNNISKIPKRPTELT